MELIWQIISILGGTIWTCLKSIIHIIVDNFSTILEIKKIVGYFSPAGMIALYFGVPTFVITLLVVGIRKSIRKG